MNSSLLLELSPSISKIVNDYNLRIVTERREKSFNNAFVEIEGDEFDIRVIRDKGLISVDLSSKKERRWRDLRTILSFIKKVDVSEDTERLSLLFNQNWREVSELMTGDLRGLDAYRKKKSEEFIRKIFPNG